MKWGSALIVVLLGVVFSSVCPAQPVDDWFSRAVSIQGDVEARRKVAPSWSQVRMNEIFQSEDTVRVLRHSRAAFLLRDDTILRLDQNSVVTFLESADQKHPLMDMVSGVVHFFSRTPKQLRVRTPFVNAAVEGTEFLVMVGETQASILVLEGRVRAENPLGSLVLGRGQLAVADAHNPPRLVLPVRTRDEVAWTIHYPSVLDFGTAVEQPGIEPVLEAWSGREYPRALALLDRMEPSPLVSALRAELLLQVGRWQEARSELETVLGQEPGNALALSQLAVMHVVRGETEEGLRLAGEAVASDRRRAAPHVALSYAHQAMRRVDQALAATSEAVRVEPGNGLAQARHAEMLLASGRRNEAVEAARRAAALRPDLGRTHSVLGFSHLAVFDPESARQSFEQAAALDQTDPLPRLGLGLASIRQGRLAEGRTEMEVALGLDPGNALVRSYLGKAYFAENRGAEAMGQLETAKELDPNDPTPYLYEAFILQSRNRPAEALLSLQESIRRNENRAVYRSSLFLDRDLAARSSSLAWIYNDLSFDQLAIKEGWVSVHDDPASFSAHRVLADSYGALPRHESARVSALLQSQLLQPVTMNPVLPHMAEPQLFIFESAGPMDPGFNEFNPLFQRNGANLLLSGVAGGDGILGNEAVLSGLYGGLSFSLGQFHYQTDGFRPNTDLEQDIYNAFVQWSPDGQTSLQAEYRFVDVDKGDPLQRFYPEFFWESRKTELRRSMRLGLHHAPAPQNVFLGSVIVQNDDLTYEDIFSEEIESRIEEDVRGTMIEGQHMFHGERINTIVGAGHYSATIKDSATIRFFDPEFFELELEDRHTIEHNNLYLYSLVNGPWHSTWTIGASVDFFDDGSLTRDQINPKLGAIIRPAEGTTIHAAAFRTMQRDMINGQTIEPTQVAGFTQYYDREGLGADTWLYGLGIHQRVTPKISAGVKAYRRDIEMSFQGILPPDLVEYEDWKEELIQGYVNWILHPWITADFTVLWEHFDLGRVPFLLDLYDVTTRQATLGVSFFHPSGFRARLAGSYVDQKGDFVDPTSPEPPDFFFGAVVPGEEEFWILDGSVGFLFPNRRGLISFEAKNIFNESFRFQSTDPYNPRFYPERLLLARLTLSF
jgi:tetratricopeptide (TPR) repeat protein